MRSWAACCVGLFLGSILPTSLAVLSGLSLLIAESVVEAAGKNGGGWWKTVAAGAHWLVPSLGMSFGYGGAPFASPVSWSRVWLDFLHTVVWALLCSVGAILKFERRDFAPRA